MSLLLLFQGAQVGAPPPPSGPAQILHSAEMVSPLRKHGREMRAYRQSLADEDAVIAFVISFLGGRQP